MPVQGSDTPWGSLPSCTTVEEHPVYSKTVFEHPLGPKPYALNPKPSYGNRSGLQRAIGLGLLGLSLTSSTVASMGSVLHCSKRLYQGSE